MKKINYIPCRGVPCKFNWKHYKFMFFLMFILSITANAQNLNITGTVKDPQNTPVFGATILIKGTTRGVSSDFDGKFSLDVPTGKTLVISYIGFKTQEIVVKNETPLKSPKNLRLNY